MLAPAKHPTPSCHGLRKGQCRVSYILPIFGIILALFPSFLNLYKFHLFLDALSFKEKLQRGDFDNAQKEEDNEDNETVTEAKKTKEEKEEEDEDIFNSTQEGEATQDNHLAPSKKVEEEPTGRALKHPRKVRKHGTPVCCS